MNDSPNWSLTANSRSLQAAALKAAAKRKPENNTIVAPAIHVYKFRLFCT